MAIEQSVITLNDFADLRVRQTPKSTKGRVSINVKSEPILADLDERRLGQGPANAIRDLLSAKIKGIGEQVSEGTKLKRVYAEAAYARGARWAVRRYSGGRIGPTPPKPNEERYFNHSGRLAEGLFVRENPVESGFTINVPANRFSLDTFTGAELRAALDKLGQLVPELRNAAALARHPEVRAAVREAANEMVVVAKGRLAAAKRRRTQALLNLIGARSLASLLG